MKNKLIIFIMILSLFLTGCGCAILGMPPDINKKEYKDEALKYTREEVGTEKYEYVSSKKIDSEHKVFYFSSTERNLEFKTTLELAIASGWPVYESHFETDYYQKVYKIYEDRVNDLIKGYYSNQEYYTKTDTEVNLIFKIETKNDIEKFITVVNELNKVFNDEEKYGGMQYVKACITDSNYLSSVNCYTSSATYAVSIDGNTTDLSNKIREDIYQKIKDDCIKIEGLDNLCEKVEIDDIYLNDHKMTYDEDENHNVYISPGSSLVEKVKSNNNYYIKMKESDGQSVFAQYLTVLGIPYTINDDTISFERAGNKYEISGKHENNGTDATTFKAIINGSDYPCDYIKQATGYLKLNLDDFAYLLGLKYEIKDSVKFSS